MEDVEDAVDLSLCLSVYEVTEVLEVVWACTPGVHHRGDPASDACQVRMVDAAPRVVYMGMDVNEPWRDELPLYVNDLCCLRGRD